MYFINKNLEKKLMSQSKWVRPQHWTGSLYGGSSQESIGQCGCQAMDCTWVMAQG